MGKNNPCKTKIAKQGALAAREAELNKKIFQVINEILLPMCHLDQPPITVLHLDPWTFTRHGIQRTLSCKPCIMNDMVEARSKVQGLLDEVVQQHKS